MAQNDGGKPWPDVHKLVKQLVPVRRIQEVGFENARKELGISLQGLHDRLDALAKLLDVERNDIVTPGQHASVSRLGECVQNLCEAITHEVVDFHAQIDQVKKELPKAKSELRLAIVSSVWLAEQDWMQSALQHTSPAIVLVPQPGVSRVVDDEIINGEADVAINYAPKFLSSAFDKQDWRKEPMVLVVSAACAGRAKGTRRHMFTRGKGELKPKHATLEDISRIDNKKFYVMPKGTPMHELVMSYLAKHRIVVDGHRFVEKQTVEEAIPDISDDKGIGILPIGNAEKDQAAKGLVIFPLEQELDRRLSIIYPRRSQKRKAVEAFKTYVLDHDEQSRDN